MKILKFYSETCGPCKAQEKILKEFREKCEIQDIDIALDENTDIIDKYDIKHVPAMLIFDDNGTLVARLNGLTPTDKIKWYIKN